MYTCQCKSWASSFPSNDPTGILPGHPNSHQVHATSAVAHAHKALNRFSDEAFKKLSANFQDLHTIGGVCQICIVCMYCIGGMQCRNI